MWWPGMDSSIEDIVGSYTECQAMKMSPSAAPLHPWQWPSNAFQRLHIDFTGPFQGSMFLVGIDAYSKGPQVALTQSTTVSKTMEVVGRVFSIYSLPEHIVQTMDRNSRVKKFAVFMKSNIIRHTHTAPYHPVTNGVAERSLKQGLKASPSSGRSLSHRLDNFLFMYRSSIHSTTGVTPSSLFLRRELRTCFDLLRPSIEVEVAHSLNRNESTIDILLLDSLHLVT